MNQPRQAILVLGMHRSGTSALTRVIALCGAGLPGHLMAPSPESNASGFWESRPIVDLHDDVLAAMGSSWSDVRRLPQAWFASREAEPFRERLSDTLKAEYGTAPQFVVKDPRLCRLMPLWRPVLESLSITPKIVIPVRHPLEVAASLEQREGFDPSRGLVLWLGHMLAAEHDSRGLARCFITYDHLLADWRATIARVGEALGFDWPDQADAAAIDDFLQGGLRHHAIATTATLPEWVAATYRWLIAATESASPPAALDRIAAVFAIAEALFGPVIEPLETALAGKSAELRHWIDTAVSRYDIIEDLRAEIARLSRNSPLSSNDHRSVIKPSP